MIAVPSVLANFKDKINREFTRNYGFSKGNNIAVKNGAKVSIYVFLARYCRR
jgi:hypothetical protein